MGAPATGVIIPVMTATDVEITDDGTQETTGEETSETEGPESESLETDNGQEESPYMMWVVAPAAIAILAAVLIMGLQAGFRD